MKKCIVCCLVVLLVAACRREEAEESVASALSEMAGLNEAGDTDGSVAKLEEMLLASDDDKERSEYFVRLLRVRLDAGLHEDAHGMFLRVIGEDEDLTRAGFGAISSYYSRADMKRELVDWTAELAKAPLPADLAELAYAWQLMSLFKDGRRDRMLELLPGCIGKFDLRGCRRIISVAYEFVGRGGKLEESALVLEAVAKAAADMPELLPLIGQLRVNLLVKQKNWQEAEAEFLAIAATLEGDLQPCLSQMLSGAIADGQFDLVDRVSEHVFEHMSGDQWSVSECARHWVDVARLNGDAGAVVERLEALGEMDIVSLVAVDIYKLSLYFVADKGSREDVRTTVALAEKLLATLEGDRERNLLLKLIFDGAFVAEDYDKVLECLNSGLPGYDAAWHEMSINKAEAHKALKEGRIEDAVQRFRNFMVYVSSSWSKPETDPSTGIAHTREMALGFNAARIGDILAGDGQSGLAAGAYAEAMSYYEKALSQLEVGSRECELVEKMLAELGEKKDKL